MKRPNIYGLIALGTYVGPSFTGGALRAPHQLLTRPSPCQGYVTICVGMTLPAPSPRAAVGAIRHARVVKHRLLEFPWGLFCGGGRGEGAVLQFRTLQRHRKSGLLCGYNNCLCGYGDCLYGYGDHYVGTVTAMWGE